MWGYVHPLGHCASDLRVIVPFVEAEVLSVVSGRSRPLHDDAVEGLCSCLHAVRIGSCDHSGEGGAPLVCDDVPLRPQLLPLSVGLGPVFFPPERRLDRARVEGLPLPLDSFQLVVLVQEPCPQLLEDAFADPLLEPSVARRARDVLLRKGLPLAPRPQHVEDSIEHLPVRYWRPLSRAWLLLPQDGSYLYPEAVRDTPDRRQFCSVLHGRRE